MRWQKDSSKIDKAIRRSLEADKRAANYHQTGSRDQAYVSEDDDAGDSSPLCHTLTQG